MWNWQQVVLPVLLRPLAEHMELESTMHEWSEPDASSSRTSQLWLICPVLVGVGLCMRLAFWLSALPPHVKKYKTKTINVWLYVF